MLLALSLLFLLYRLLLRRRLWARTERDRSRVRHVITSEEDQEQYRGYDVDRSKDIQDIVLDAFTPHVLAERQTDDYR